MVTQYQLVTGILYAELVFVLILILPVMSPRTWQTLFGYSFPSLLFDVFMTLFNWTLVIIFSDKSFPQGRTCSAVSLPGGCGGISQCCTDSVTCARAYRLCCQSGPIVLESVELEQSSDAEMVNQIKFSQAERDLYIAGFALFLWLVLGRTIKIIDSMATLTTALEESRRQANNAG